MSRLRRVLELFRRPLGRLACLLLGIAFIAAAQQSAPPPPAAAAPPPASAQNEDFLKAADEVLAEMSKLISLPVLKPLKKSMRSREEIRDYLLRKMDEDKDADKRYADQKVLEKFALIPKNYPLDREMVKILTEQIAGLYDPDSEEFFIADWNDPSDQRMVMSHELTHALQDQHFHIEKWGDAAKPDDDAELARDAVLEGSAMAAMLDYILRDQGRTVRDLGTIDPELLMGDPESSPELAHAPKVIQDELLFPYVSGTTFTQRLLQVGSGWPDFYKVFAKPPVSTQQIMHPNLYLAGVAPPPLTLPATAGALPAEWKKLDENKMGEFGVLEILKQFLTKDRAADLAASWSSDRYAIFEDQKTKRTLLLFRLRLANDGEAARFFGAYSEALELKYQERSELLRRPNFFSFDTPDGGVFLRCFESDCFTMEGAGREIFDRLTHEMGWPAGPAAPKKPQKSGIKAADSSAWPLGPRGNPRDAGPPMRPMAP